MFVGNQRTWRQTALRDVAEFKRALVDGKLSPADVVVHGSYLINVGNPDKVWV